MQRLENKSSQLAHNNITAKDDEKRIKHIIGHLMLLRKMHHTLSKNEPVGHVIDARVFVSSSSEAVVEFFSPPNSLTNVIIQYKVEWSCSPTFNKIEGSLLITDMRQTCVKIPNLIHGQFYSFRITAGSMFGYGQQILAAPTQIKISSWEDVDGVVVGSSGSQNHRELINTLSREVDRLRNSTVWQRVFPVISDGLIKKKKLGLKHLFSASSKFVKHANKGIYLACIIYTNDKILTTVDDMLPIMTIEESNYKGLSANDIKWLMKLSQCWDEIYSIQDATTSCSNNFQFRGLTVETVLSMINALGLKDIGKVHHAPIVYEQNGSIFIVTVRYAIENQILQGLAMKWITLNKFMRKKNSCAAIDYLNTEAINILNFYEASQIPLNRGLYLCYLKMESTLNTIRLMVPDNMPSTLPFVCIRDNPHVSSEEWDWIQKLNDNPENLSNHSSPTNDERDTPESSASIIQNIFHEKLYRAVNLLLSDLEVAPENFGQHRLYRLNVFQMDSDVSMILMVPKTDEVCLMSIGNNSISALDYGKGCTTIPIPVFEMIHLSAYQPDFIALYSQLSVFVEYFTMVTQYEYRKSLVENDAKVYKEMLEKLNDFQERLETIWKNARWITNIATEARDLKQTSHFVDVAKIKFEPVSDDFRINLPRNVESKSAGQVVNSLLSTKNGYINGLKKELAYSSMIPKSIQKSVFKSKDNSLFNLDKLFINGKKINHDKVLKNIPNTSPRNSLVDNSANRSPSPRLRSASQGSQFFRFRNKSPYSNPNTPRKGKFTRTETTSVMEESEHPSSQAYDKEDSTQFGMLRVYVAFDCGFSKGSSVRLRVSKTTTSLEVVALVVKQMSHLKDKMEQDIIVESKHEKIKFVEADYCLVVVIGARERRLRNDFKPLHLSAPWNRGKLFVRHTDLVLDAVLCGNEVAV
uniref:Ras-associating domain-containing protein n=1 Tax=Rhabditophanes sp. KR3021 TaxID=114890 RepID=A0AC35U3F3_9BILA